MHAYLVNLPTQISRQGPAEVMPVSHDLGFIFIFFKHCCALLCADFYQGLIFTPSLSSFTHIFSGTAGAGISQEDS